MPVSSSMPSWRCSPEPGTFPGSTIPRGSRGHWRFSRLTASNSSVAGHRPVGGDRAGLRTVHCCDLWDARHRVSASEVERATSAEPRMEPLWSPWLQPVSITAPPGGVDRASRRRDLLTTRTSYMFHSPRGELRSNVRTLAGERATLTALRRRAHAWKGGDWTVPAPGYAPVRVASPGWRRFISGRGVCRRGLRWPRRAAR